MSRKIDDGRLGERRFIVGHFLIGVIVDREKEVVVLPTALHHRHAGRPQERPMIAKDVPLQILTVDASQLVKVGRQWSLASRLQSSV